MSCKKWSDDEKKILIDLFADNYTNDICKILNRSYGSVTSQSYLLGLKKSEKFMAMELKKQADRLKKVGEKSRFKKGQHAHNKGKPMSKDVYDKIKHTFYQKGNIPHNTKYDGYESLAKGYLEIRVAQGQYEKKHRHIWMQHHGEIPENHIIVFKDKNRFNFDIDNLEMITIAENMKRNAITRFPSELRKAIHLIKKINQKLYAKKQN